MYFLSLLMIFISSYLILSVISQKTKRVYGFLYFLLTAFSQIILSFEVLSLFSLINRNNFLICNFIFLIASCLLFTKSERRFYIPETKSEFKKILFALNSDKLLMFCAICFSVFIIFQLISVFTAHEIFNDALVYYFPRTLEWINRGNLSHFVTPDPRELIMPVNFDMLYMLHFLFLKTEKATAIYSFIGYLGTINGIYILIKELGFSVRRALWSIFVFSSFVLVFTEAVNVCSELTAGGLLLACILFYLAGSKYNDKIAIYFSSLSLALAIGVKTTALIALPSVILTAAVISFYYKPSRKNSVLFVTAFIFNFLIFSSYNYVLNLLRFSDPLTCNEAYFVNKLQGGVKGFLSNLIKYGFMFLDPSGFNFTAFNKFAENINNYVLSVFGLNSDNYVSPYFPSKFIFSSVISMTESFLGITGLIAFLPCIFFVFKKNTQKNGILKTLLFSFVINTVVLSAVMVFTQYNNKYLITFIVLAAPVLVYSYSKKASIYKILLSFLVFWYFIVQCGERNIYILSGNDIKPREEITVYEKMKDLPAGKTAIIARGKVYYFGKLIFKGFPVEKLLIENIEDYDLKQYKYIITAQDYVFSDRVLYSGAEKNPQCDYFDNRNRFIDDKNPAAAVEAGCPVPHEYFARNGFQYLFETNKFIILTNGEK